MEAVVQEEIGRVDLDSRFVMSEMEVEEFDDAPGLSPFTAVALILSFSTLYLQWNRYLATRDAAEYAARIKKQLQQTAEEMEMDSMNDETEHDDEEESDDDESSEGNQGEEAKTVEQEEDFEMVDLPAEVEKDIAENYSASLKKIGIDSDDSDNDITKSVDSREEDKYSNEAIKASMTTSSNDNQWRCACADGGFLPPGMLSSLGGAEAVFRLGTGQCYHKQA
jgi:hypothetical protein